MKLFAYRWENGDASIVYARDALDALNRLEEFGSVGSSRMRPEGGYQVDEVGSLELGRLVELKSLILDFKLDNDGQLELQELGEEIGKELYDWAYPHIQGVWSEMDEEHPEFWKRLTEAVEIERRRLEGGA
jgi:hypothetical protein